MSLGCLLALLAFFLWERISLAKCRRLVPLRIAVAGTRGKSTVARLIAAGLRGSGRRVLARTTGSRQAVIFPDASEVEIERKGPPSLLEGKALLRLARKIRAEALVVELMSIHPEYLAVEAGHLFQPSIVALTNVRLDHRDVMGRTKEEIAHSLSAAIPPRSTVFLHGGECPPAFEEKAKKVRARLVQVDPFPDGPALSGRNAGRLSDFPENISLALAVAQACGASRKAARQTMTGAGPDLGALRAWKVRFGRPPRVWTCVSAFAANEPESTKAILARVKKAGLLEAGPRLALLNLREDRPDRTGQWLEAAGQGFFREFDMLAVSGASRALARRLGRALSTKGPRFTILSGRDPRAAMEELLKEEKKGGVLIGVGNIGGLGRSLVEHWTGIGKTCD